MSSFTASRCRHIKVNGTQCGSPALRHKNFCFFHNQDRPLKVPCYYEQEYPLGEIDLPLFEDAHSIQSVLRQVVQMVMQKRLEQKTASLLLYALQIASSNLKRMELEKPQPEQVVTDLDAESKFPMAAVTEDEPARAISDESSDESSSESLDERFASEQPEWGDRPHYPSTRPANYEDKIKDKVNENENFRSGQRLPPGTIHACYRPGSQRPKLMPQ
jgi:hypothetical protein